MPVAGQEAQILAPSDRLADAGPARPAVHHSSFTSLRAQRSDLVDAVLRPVEIASSLRSSQ
jgi:hypothetical protein